MHWLFQPKLAAAFLAPFLALSTWFGMHATTTLPTFYTPVACTMDAKICPDGSSVGRVPPSCNFAACPGATSTPHAGVRVTSMSPRTGPVGTSVTLHGSGFTSDNTIIFGTGVVMHVAAQNSTTLTFTVPDGLSPRCYFSNPRCLVLTRQTTPGVYSVSVENSNGASNEVHFTVTGKPEPVSDVTISTLTPKSGPVGTQVSITGFGFTDDNMVHFGNGAIAHVPVSSSVAIACTTDPNCRGGIRQTLVITVPDAVGPYCPPGSMCAMYLQEVTPGTYQVYVTNSNGTSNTVSFTVTGQGSGSNGTLSISGLDAPPTLAIGEQGTWTVHVRTGGSVGQLHYSVLWGDENAALSAIRYPGPIETQTSATLTHTYQHSGTYTVTITVSDDNKHSETTTSTITVTPLY